MSRRASAKTTSGVVTGWLRFWPGNGYASLLVRDTAGGTWGGKEVSFHAPRAQVETCQREQKGKPVTAVKHKGHIVVTAADGRTYKLDMPTDDADLPDGDLVNAEF